MNMQLQQIQDWPERAKQADYCVAKLAQACGVSPRTLERHFLQETGKHPKAWLLAKRLEQAGKLLQDGSSVKAAAADLGYKHPNHLTNAFKKHKGYCPTNQSPPSPASTSLKCRVFVDIGAFSLLNWLQLSCF
jgi:transcriptional regulator GlxA family with amidase domain